MYDNGIAWMIGRGNLIEEELEHHAREAEQLAALRAARPAVAFHAARLTDRLAGLVRRERQASETGCCAA